MGYDATNLVCRTPQAGAQGIKEWTYYTTDNLASSASGAAIPGNYFGGVVSGARFDYPNMATGDIILAVNGSTPVLTTLVVSAFNGNGVSVVVCSGSAKDVARYA